MDLQKFEDYLCTLRFDTLVRAWNEFCCSENGSAGDAIYDSVEALHDEGLVGGLELARSVFFGSVESWYDKVYFDGYGNLESTWDLEHSPIDINCLAKWLTEEEHEVYEEWKNEITGEFSEHLAANVDQSELYELWVSYEFEGEPASDEEVDDMFDVEILAADLIKDNHQLFQDWLAEQEDEEV